jgi:NAD(P)-dependent dehydrogenase (short-subunit alcohol dehydrogenase family)
MLLKDKVVLVSGIGPGLGVKLAVEAARTPSKLDDAEKRIAALGADCTVLKVVTDITDRAQCRKLVQQASERFGRIDGLLNSAFIHGNFPKAIESVDLGCGARYSTPTCAAR